MPVLRSEWREPLRAQRDPLAGDGGRPRSNRDERRQWRKQTWLGRFVSTYGWRAYALPILIAVTGLVMNPDEQKKKQSAHLQSYPEEQTWHW